MHPVHPEWLCAAADIDTAGESAAGRRPPSADQDSPETLTPIEVPIRTLAPQTLWTMSSRAGEIIGILDKRLWGLPAHGCVREL
jgi:hypothetical protein